MATRLSRPEVQNLAIQAIGRPIISDDQASILPGAIAVEACIPHPQDEEKTEELERKAWFQDAVNEKLNIPTGYSKVAVLIVKWHDDIDPLHVGHNEEIARLKALFEDRFHYVCTTIQLQNSKKPQHTLNRAIMEHVENYDGPNNLLIVYYTGHGRTKDGNLELSATAHVSKTKGCHQATAYWFEAEAPLLSKSTEADALAILDCCFASNAHYKESGEERRTYELIAATPKDQPTRAPGPSSFTTALTNSLEELLQKYKNRNFTTSKLQEKICTKQDPRFPPMLCDRLGNDYGHVKLAPLDDENVEKQNSFQSQKPEEAWINLRFSLEQPTLTQEQIEDFARQLPAACKAAHLPVRRIDWLKMGLTTESAKALKLSTIATVIAAAQRMKRGSQQSPFSDSAHKTEESFSYKRQRTGESPKDMSSGADYLTPRESGEEASISPTSCVESRKSLQDE